MDRVIWASIIEICVTVVCMAQLQTDNKTDDAPDKQTVAAKELTVYRTGQIVGMPVKNSAGQDLGKVEDLVIDISAGKVRYIAVSFGGILGVGDKLFAVPQASFKLRQNAVDDSRYLELDVDKKRLENAKGFAKDHWPNFADSKWELENDKVYE